MSIGHWIGGEGTLEDTELVLRRPASLLLFPHTCPCQLTFNDFGSGIDKLDRMGRALTTMYVRMDGWGGLTTGNVDGSWFVTNLGESVRHWGCRRCCIQQGGGKGEGGWGRLQSLVNLRRLAGRLVFSLTNGRLDWSLLLSFTCHLWKSIRRV